MTKAEKLVQLIEKALDDGVELGFSTGFKDFELLSVYPSEANPKKIWFDIKATKE
jgi:hypothetical protein